MTTGKQSKPWVVVVHGGTADEYEDGSFSSWTLAIERAEEIERQEGRQATVLKRTAAGDLTTEY